MFVTELAELHLQCHHLIRTGLIKWIWTHLALFGRWSSLIYCREGQYKLKQPRWAEKGQRVTGCYCGDTSSERAQNNFTFLCVAVKKNTYCSRHSSAHLPQPWRIPVTTHTNTPWLMNMTYVDIQDMLVNIILGDAHLTSQLQCGNSPLE